MIDVPSLKASIDIVDVIGGYIDLKKKGDNYTACCPFHEEKTPSFSVSQTKQFYHCFGCGCGGDAIDFIKEYNSVDFVSAAKILGGEDLPEDAAIKRKQAIAAELKRNKEEYYQAKEFDMFFQWGMTGEKYTHKNINKLDACHDIIRKYELNHPRIVYSDRSKAELKFWSKIIMNEMDTRLLMLSHFIANKLIQMKKAGKPQNELKKAFLSIANKSKYDNSTLKNEILCLMKQPDNIENYTIHDLNVKHYSDLICSEKIRDKRIEMLADTPKKYRAGVAELVAIEFKLKSLTK